MTVNAHYTQTKSDMPTTEHFKPQMEVAISIHPRRIFYADSYRKIMCCFLAFLNYTLYRLINKGWVINLGT